MLKIKGYLTAILGFALTVVTALFYRQKAETEQIKREASEAAREADKKASEAVIIGMGDEERVRQEIENNPVKRTDLT